MRSLSPVERRELRAKAHHLDPVVAIGRHGLTDSVLHEIDVALTAHELIKVRVADDDRDARERLATRICDVLGCAPVQHLGKLLILWRPRPVDETPGAPARRAGKAKAAAAGTAPLRSRTARTARKTATARLRGPRAMAPAGTPKAGEAKRGRRTAHAAPPAAAPRAPSARRRRRQA